MKFIKNQKVTIVKTKLKETKVIADQDKSTPGVYIIKDVKPNCKYRIEISGKLNIKGILKLFIGDANKKEIIYKAQIPMFKREFSVTHIYDNQNYKKIKIGVMFSYCYKADYFIINKFKVTETINDDEFNKIINNYVKIRDSIDMKDKLNEITNCLKKIPNFTETISADQIKQQCLQKLKEIYSKGITNINKNIILYMISGSLPYDTSGYTLRTHKLINNFNSSQSKYYIIPVTKLAYKNKLKNISPIDKIDNVYYFRLLNVSKFNNTDRYLHLYESAFILLLIFFRPYIIHGVSNWKTSLVPINMCNNIGIKNIYEIRGRWELSQIGPRYNKGYNSDYEMDNCFENKTVTNAKNILCISKQLGDYVNECAKINKKITQLENFYDSYEIINYPLAIENIYKNYAFSKDNFIIGYIGNFSEYEGIDILVEAFDKLYTIGDLQKKIKLLLVGNIDKNIKLKESIKNLRSRRSIFITGNIPNNKILDYYNILDVFCCPRKDYKVCQIVPPIKLMNCIGLGKLILASDVDALCDQLGGYGVYFKKNDPVDLTNKLQDIIDGKITINKLELIKLRDRYEIKNIIKKLSDYYDKL